MYFKGAKKQACNNAENVLVTDVFLETWQKFTEQLFHQTFTDVLVEGLTCIYDLLIKGVLEMFQEQSGEIRSVLPAVFFEKAVPKMFGKFLENYLRQRILKTHNYAEYELWR